MQWVHIFFNHQLDFVFPMDNYLLHAFELE